MTRFAGKSVIITGSSFGIGRSTAILFAQEGAKVTVTGRNSEKLGETVKQILDVGVPAENVNLVIGDITTGCVQDELISSTIKKFGKIDILVNNAGASISDKDKKTGIDQHVEVYDQIFKLNVRTVVEITQKARPHLAESKGEIINISSIAAGPQAQPVQPYYGMSKAALDQLTRSLAVNLIPEGIRVNSVSPGAVRTGFTEAKGFTGEQATKVYDFLGSRKECVPYGTVGTPENIAEIIAFLADRKASSYIIGQTIVADGGSTLIMGMAAHDMNSILSS